MNRTPLRSQPRPLQPQPQPPQPPQPQSPQPLPPQPRLRPVPSVPKLAGVPAGARRQLVEWMQSQRQALQEERAALSWLLQAVQGCAREARGGFEQVVGRLAQAEAQQLALAGRAKHTAARAAEAELHSLRERLRATQRERGAALGRADALEAEVAKLREVGIRLEAREQVLRATQGSLSSLQHSSRAELAAAAERARAAEAAAEAAQQQQAAAALLAREELEAVSAAEAQP